MNSETTAMKQDETLYDTLAKAIDTVRQSAKEREENEYEVQFLVKLAFLSLREINDVKRQQTLIEIASENLG